MTKNRRQFPVSCRADVCVYAMCSDRDLKNPGGHVFSWASLLIKNCECLPSCLETLRSDQPDWGRWVFAVIRNSILCAMGWSGVMPKACVYRSPLGWAREDSQETSSKETNCECHSDYGEEYTGGWGWHASARGTHRIDILGRGRCLLCCQGAWVY